MVSSGATDHMQERGDRIGPRYELAEAERLEQEAELNPEDRHMHERIGDSSTRPDEVDMAKQARLK
jgi:hypothetical protein